MPSTQSVASGPDAALAEAVLRRICDELSVFLDRPLALEQCVAARSEHKIAGERVVHVAFKLGLTLDGVVQHGAVLVPLRDAIAFAGYLMLLPDDVVAARRRDVELDHAFKSALMEVSRLVGGAVDAALHEQLPERAFARSEGCQGLRAGTTPAFERSVGTELLVVRAKLKLHTYPSFEMLVMLPSPPVAAA